MKLIKNPLSKIFLVLAFFILVFHDIAHCREDKKLYKDGIQAAREGNSDIAFIKFHMLLNSFPDSEYSQNALFSAGEYYFLINDSSNAKKSFEKFLNDYPEAEIKPFVIAYLLKIAENRQQHSSIEKLTKTLVGSQQVSLLFRDFEELKYLSALNKNYKAINFIDKIEIYIDEEIFAEISF